MADSSIALMGGSPVWVQYDLLQEAVGYPLPALEHEQFDRPRLSDRGGATPLPQWLPIDLELGPVSSVLGGLLEGGNAVPRHVGVL